MRILDVLSNAEERGTQRLTTDMAAAHRETSHDAAGVTLLDRHVPAIVTPHGIPEAAVAASGRVLRLPALPANAVRSGEAEGSR